MFYLCIIFFCFSFLVLVFQMFGPLLRYDMIYFAIFFTFCRLISLFVSIACYFIITILNCRVSISLISFDWYNCFLTLFHLSVNHLTFSNFVLTYSVCSLFYWLFYYFGPFIINMVDFLCWFYLVFSSFSIFSLFFVLFTCFRFAYFSLNGFFQKVSH